MSLSNKAYLQINQAIFSLAHAYESRMAQEQVDNVLDLALSDCSVLMVLGQFGTLNARQLSQLMDINPGTISVYVQRLVKKGLVEKERDQEDRRNWWLHLTTLGQEVYKAIVDRTVAYTRDFLATLDEQERQTLHQLLLKASHSLGFDWQ